MNSGDRVMVTVLGERHPARVVARTNNVLVDLDPPVRIDGKLLTRLYRHADDVQPDVDDEQCPYVDVSGWRCSLAAGHAGGHVPPQ